MSINLWLCWFFLVIKMWGLLATSNAPITDNAYLSHITYFFHGLLANLANFLIFYEARSMILGIFDIFSPSQDGTPLRTLEDC